MQQLDRIEPIYTFPLLCPISQPPRRCRASLYDCHCSPLTMPQVCVPRYASKTSLRSILESSSVFRGLLQSSQGLFHVLVITCARPSYVAIPTLVPYVLQRNSRGINSRRYMRNGKRAMIPESSYVAVVPSRVTCMAALVGSGYSGTILRTSLGVESGLMDD